MGAVSSRERRKGQRKVKKRKMVRIPKNMAPTLSQDHFWMNLCRMRILVPTSMRRK
jgi:hypothetical protein